MIDRVFEDELLVYTEDNHVDDDVKESLQKDVMLCFPSNVNHEEENIDREEARIREVVETQEEEGWTIVVHKLKKKVDNKRNGELVVDDAISKNATKEVGKVSKCKWIPRADLVLD
ncbi:hypothetical protein D8674_026166 [Pyrus ussuriensis x Pyrus communis]|uniref:Uncharacterized protein n=1 Tax=Pyrus ussuriensis x Pyrus communis TaxID=2448454 RepID=A0A5N5IAX7_9ROSA|nr:hypothetical protein D8674_026166 [Pyrus ussuriensis x Pyrus communis]